MILPLDPDHPHERHLLQVVELLRRDGVIVYPTDTAYGLGCSVGSRKAIHRLASIKDGSGGRRKKLFTLVAPNLSVASHFVVLSDRDFHLLRESVPGPYTFILGAHKMTPKKVQSHRKTLGVRIPEHPFVAALLSELGEPLVSISAPHPEGARWSDPVEIDELLGGRIDLTVDCGILPLAVSSIIDLTGSEPIIVREGIGDLERFR